MVNIKKPIKRDILAERTDHLSKVLGIESFAWKSKFYKRTPKKITGTNLFVSFWEMQKEGKNSLRNWALKLGALEKLSITKQSLDERLNERTVAMAKLSLKEALSQSNLKRDKKLKKRLKKVKKDLKRVLDFFTDIILHDSTTQKVAQQLVEHFPGNRAGGEIRAVMRIQAVFSLKEEKWIDLTVGSYSENDQSNAEELVGKLKKNDLLIRDLGYFTLNALEQLVEHQYIITKWDNKTFLYHPDGKQIDLLDFLNKNSRVDQAVLVGKNKKIPMRLVARELPKKKVEQRIEAAKNDRNMKANHNDEYYELLRYEIYLTNVPGEVLDVEKVAKMYGLRWYIEILFKSWKSYFNFKKMFGKERMSYHRALVSIYLILIQFVYLTTEILNYIKEKVERPEQEIFISILKFMDVANSLLSALLTIRTLSDLDILIPQFSKHSTYQKRKKRKNMKEKFQYFKELTY